MKTSTVTLLILLFVTQALANPCKDTICPQGTSCDIDPWGLSQCINKTKGPCEQVICPLGYLCDVNVIGHPICMKHSVPCGSESCVPGTHCERNIWGYVACIDNSVHCASMTCREGTHCETDFWGVATCEADPTPTCRDLSCPDGTHCADGTCVKNPPATPCGHSTCPSGTYCGRDRWGYAACMNNSVHCASMTCREGTHCETDFWNVATCVATPPSGPCVGVVCPSDTTCEPTSDGWARCVRNLADPCNFLLCPSSAPCIAKEGLALCVANSSTADLCAKNACTEDDICIVTSEKSSKCMIKGTTCSDVKCTALDGICVYGASNVPRCMNKTDKCTNIKCPTGLTCVVNQWGTPQCTPRINECSNVQCPTGTHCFSTGPILQCRNNTGPCDAVECPLNEICKPDEWNRPTCSPNTNPTASPNTILTSYCRNGCKEGTKCGLNQWGKAVCLTLKNLCLKERCEDAIKTCVVNQWGSTQCVSLTASITCGKVTCKSGEFCRVVQDGFPQCTTNQGPCDNTQCPVGSVCVVDSWGRPLCARRFNDSILLVVALCAAAVVVAVVALIVVWRRPAGVLAPLDQEFDELGESNSDAESLEQDSPKDETITIM
eukprot:TRINITY_DN646_c0_g1_i2.p1 TRINITY_DN646_c0_g1~~TRINITY_DN646_c0_g1_i2.p1  ORF type:complete len:614 (+),score=67.08 TRINITY_DN646_c0_g1_i2:23-1843(+)